jgi:ribosomal protein S18 acetylase RimI-like enzyme
MYLRPLLSHDRAPLSELLRRIEVFTEEEREVALELVDDALQHPATSTYRFLMALEPQKGDGEALLGYLCYGRTPMTDRTWDMYWIAVDPVHRRKQVGRELNRALEETIRQEGGGIIRVETASRKEYQGTVRFYLGVGYRQAGCIPQFYAADDDLLILIKTV